MRNMVEEREFYRFVFICYLRYVGMWDDGGMLFYYCSFSPVLLLLRIINKVLKL